MNPYEKNLFLLCKIGDLQRIQHLVEKEDIQLNIRDRWDSTPLYYACLCGHIEVVEYLLANGARCEANTFDGERCIYGALTDQIRNILRSSKTIHPKLDAYELFLERLYELGSYADFILEVNSRVFKVHKIILAARSEYFRLKFETKWQKRDYFCGTHELLFEQNLYFIKKEKNDESNSELIIEKFNLSSNEDPVDEMDLFLIGKFGPDAKLSKTIKIQATEDILTNYGKINQINLDLRALADKCLPETIRKKLDIQQTENVEHDLSKIVEITHDCRLKIRNSCYFYCHKVFLAERCEYFKTFLNDPFKEIKKENTEISATSNSKNPSISELELKDITDDILVEIIYFIYSNDFSSPKLEESLLYDVLVVADLYLLPALKRKCASELITNHLRKENLFELLRLSRLYDLNKLEFACISFLASHLLEFENSEQLRELIREDASKLKMRQETDTIEIIDDLRYAINEASSSVYHLISLSELINNNKETSTATNTFQHIIEREQKLNVIDKILHELNLEC